MSTDLRRILPALLLAAGCKTIVHEREPVPAIVGAWRARVQFADGAFAAVQDLEFLYVFNAGGTLTESSNYDAAPPVPPAYGEWRQTGAGRFEAKYSFFTTRAPADLNWLPAGSGVLLEKIVLAVDGRSYDSTLTLELFDTAGKPVEGGGSASVHAQRLGL